MHQVTTVLATSKHVLFGLNLFYSSQDMIKDRAERKAMFSPLHALIITLAGAPAITEVSGHEYWWLACGYDLEIGPV